MSAKGRSQDKGISSQRNPFKNPEEVHTLVSSNTTFAVNLFRKLSEFSPSGNVFFSPLSTSIALSMISIGTKGNTAKEIMDVLCLTGIPVSTVHSTFADMSAILMSEDGQNGCKLHLANRLFCHKDYTFLEEFLHATRTHYNADPALLDFIGDVAGSRLTINQWVEEQTTNRIRDLIPEGCINDLTTLILVNAIYFKGEWEHEFDEKNTRKEKFHVSAQESVDVNMMHLHENLNFGVNRELGCRIVELPYGNRDLSMFILLPEEPDQLMVLEEKLTSTSLQDSLKRMGKIKVNLSIPTFKLQQEFTLNNMLSALGMKDLFNKGKANLSGMDGTLNLYVSVVLHKSFIEVNEKGTEAAAATAVVMCPMSSRPVIRDFKADHPFLFLIRDNRSKAILFFGRMLHPASD